VVVKFASEFEKAGKTYLELGGWKGLKSGNWLLQLIPRSFKAYHDRANADYFRAKYPDSDNDTIAGRLTSVAARNAGLLGVAVGATVSIDEIVGAVTAGEGGVGIPGNVAVALAAIGGETILLAQIQLQLVANLARIYGVTLDPDDPEDILFILAFAVGGTLAQEAGMMAAEIGATLTESLGRKVGVKLLERTIAKYAVPGISMAIGWGWNYIATKKLGKIARKQFQKRAAERNPNPIIQTA